MTIKDRWPGYAAAAWGVLFAVPSFVWAAGSDLGARQTVSPSLVELADNGTTWFIAVLWVTGFLKLLGAVIGAALTRPQGRTTGRLLALSGAGAAVLLVWHGLLFVVQGVLVETGVLGIAPELHTLSRWYLYLWGPWFVLGGLAFAGAARGHVRRSPDRRGTTIAAAVGAAGALILSLAATLLGLG